MLDNINVLVLDDNKHMRSLVQSILHALGVKNIRDASDAAEAFKELQHFHADVIICDWHMEPLDGLDFVRLVRTAKDSPNPYVPIIMLTGYTEYRRVVEARDAGVNEFLAKPISAKALYQRFAAIIDTPRPFIRTKTYFGPDRRRQNLGPPRGTAERRKSELEKAGDSGVVAPPGTDAADGLSQQEVEALLGK
jgi:CheY-like chemotaxis protein